MDMDRATHLRAVGEPEGNWQTGQRLFDTELLVTILCRFTGFPLGHHQGCLERDSKQHPDVECRSLYFQADALHSHVVNVDAFDDGIPEEIRQPWTGGEQIGTRHG